MNVSEIKENKLQAKLQIINLFKYLNKKYNAL